MRNSTDAQLRQELDGVNQLTSQVAQLNDRIALARGTGSSPNDLLDLRDTAIRNLNAAVRVTSVPQDDGATNLFLANGQPLVVGNRAGTMAMQVSKIDPQEISLGVKDAVGNLIELDPNTIGGGTVAGLALFRANDLPKVENSLGQIAVAVSDQFNIQHKLGDDSNGAAGVNFFTPPTINAFASSLNTSAPAATVAASFVDTTQTQASDYKLQFIGGATGYQLTRASDKAVTTYATLPQTVDGMSINVAGTPAIGDVFMIQPSRNGSRNIGMAVSLPGQIAAAAPVVASQATANTGQVTVEDLSVVGPVRNANLKNTVTLNFTSASSFTYTTGAVTSAAQAFTSGQPININGWSLTLRGAPANGDVFTIGANVGGIGDNRNALKLAQLPDLALVNGGRMAGAFGGLVATVGGLAGGATTTSDAQSALLKDALNAESSVAGVNLDEEASRLMQFQQQYQAAAKIIQTARTLFDQILQLGN
jgi:flagellar hook-associated protein 1 FlgK